MQLNPMLTNIIQGSEAMPLVLPNARHSVTVSSLQRTP
jgi:hypothetical protein